VAVGRRQFWNPGRGMPAARSRYPRASEEQQTERAQCVLSELQANSDSEADWILTKKCKRRVK
jgi:hypothetical protein